MCIWFSWSFAQIGPEGPVGGQEAPENHAILSPALSREVATSRGGTDGRCLGWSQGDMGRQFLAWSMMQERHTKHSCATSITFHVSHQKSRQFHVTDSDLLEQPGSRAGGGRGSHRKRFNHAPRRHGTGAGFAWRSDGRWCDSRWIPVDVNRNSTGSRWFKHQVLLIKTGEHKTYEPP